MTKRTRAATAAGLPTDDANQDRRAILASAGAAAILAAIGAPAAAEVVEDPGDADLVALGARWEHVQAEWQALWAATPPDDDADDADVGARSSALFDEIMAIPAQTVAGLAVKARLLMVAHDVQDFSLPGVVAKATAEYEAGCRYHDRRAAYGLAADILRLAAA